MAEVAAPGFAIWNTEKGTNHMAGTRHHVIPRFLLRGFASHSVGNEAYAWVFRKARQPFNTNIINIAVEGHFYTHENRPIVDDLITDAEGSFADVVEELRTSRSAANTPPLALAELIAHLEARTRHMRENLEYLADAIFRWTIDFVEDHEAFKRFLLLRFEREPETLIRPLREEIRTQGIPDGPTEWLVSLIRPHLSTLVESMMPTLMAEFSTAMRRMRSERPNLLSGAARSGQLRALEQAIAPELKVAQYQKLTYTLVECAEELPLGDSAALFEIGASRRYTTFVSADDDLIAAYLPITSNLLLCGHHDGFIPSGQGMPSAIARCSLEYFIAHSNSREFQDLQPLVSELSAIIDEASIERLLADAFEPR